MIRLPDDRMDAATEVPRSRGQRLIALLLNRLAGHRGQGLVEFALILPIFLALTLSVVDVGRAVAIYNLTSEAARSGARAGRITPGNAAGAVTAELGTLVPNPIIAVSQAPYKDEPYIDVTVTSPFTPLTMLIIGLPNSQINITATSRQYMYNQLASGGTPYPTMTPNAAAYVEATQTAVANLAATAVSASLTGTALAGGPTPNATTTAIANASQTAVAASATAVVASQTAVAVNATATALAKISPTYLLPTIPVVVAGSTSTIAPSVACGAPGTLTSTIIAWTSQANTGLRSRLEPIGGGVPSAWQEIPPSGATLSFPVVAGVEYRVVVENTGDGSTTNKNITIITQPVTLSCPTTPP